MLTKTDIAAIRKADHLVVHLNSDRPDGYILLIKRNNPTETNPFAQDIEHVLTATANLETLRGQEALKAGQVRCFGMVAIYHRQLTAESLMLKSLRVGDEVIFSFYPDAHTNGYLAAAGLHADTLYMRVQRNGKTVARWELETSICPDNSARMCRGIPNSRDYEIQAAETRKAAA